MNIDWLLTTPKESLLYLPINCENEQLILHYHLDKKINAF